VPVRNGTPRDVLQKIIDDANSPSSRLRLLLVAGKPGAGKTTLREILHDNVVDREIIDVTFDAAYVSARDEVLQDAACSSLSEREKGKESRRRASEALVNVALATLNATDAESHPDSPGVILSLEFPGIQLADVSRGEGIFKVLRRLSHTSSGEIVRALFLVSDREVTRHAIDERIGRGMDLGATAKITDQMDRQALAAAKEFADSSGSDLEFAQLTFDGSVDDATRSLIAYISWTLREMGVLSRVDILLNRQKRKNSV
jgi:hypothetical protein